MKTLVAKRIKQLREGRGLRQKTLCKILKIDQATLSRYENAAAEPPLDTLIKLSAFFNVSVDWLIGNTDTDLEPRDYILAERISVMSKRIERNGTREEYYKYLQKQASLTADVFVSLERHLKKKKSH